MDKESAAYTDALRFIKPRALGRRAKVRPADALIDASDLPLYEPYTDAVMAAGGILHQQSRWLNAASFALTPALTNVVRRFPFVDSIAPVRYFVGRDFTSPNRDRKNPAVTAAPLDYGPSYAQDAMIHVPVLHALGITGKGVLVGMLDSGFRWRRHESLYTRHVIAEHDFIFNRDSTANGPGDGIDQDFHGTLTMSVLGGFMPGQVIGPAFDADFVLAKTELIYPSLFADTDTKIEEDDWAVGLEWEESYGVDVVSSSLGYRDFTDSTSYSWANGDFNGRTTVSARAALRAAELGVLVCDAAGNEGNGDGVTGTLLTPADADSILAVGAVDFSRLLADFSSTGPTSDGRIKPDIVAPGVDVYGAYTSCDTCYLAEQGTSLSTPLTAASAALVFSVRPELTAMQVRSLLKNDADTIDAADYPSVPNNFTGWGFVNPLRVILSLGPVFGNTPTISSTDSTTALSIGVISGSGILPGGVTLHYTVGTGTSYSSLAMQLDTSILFPTSGVYSVTIPAQSRGALIRAYVDATDSAGHSYQSPPTTRGNFWQFFYGSSGLLPGTTIPSQYRLYQNYPNPFNAGTTIAYDLPRVEAVSLKVYNVLGELVTTLVDEVQNAGNASSRPPVRFDGSNLPSGVYFYRMSTAHFSATGKMILLR